MNVADPILAEPLWPVDGTISAPRRPGTERVWDDAVVRRYRVG